MFVRIACIVLSAWIVTDAGEFLCTQVIGYSQVGWEESGWYRAGGEFERVVDNSRWQLLWANGAGVDKWRQPSYDGWDNELISPCAVNAEAPDRVLLSVSGGFGADLDAWIEAIEAAVRTIRAKLPSARMILLQAVVGGPEHSDCDGAVRAAVQHPVIDEAIERAAGDHSDVAAGYSPEVQSCEGFSDAKGHLSVSAAEAAGRAIGEYYRSFDETAIAMRRAPVAGAPGAGRAIFRMRAGKLRVVNARAGDRLTARTMAGASLYEGPARAAVSLGRFARGVYWIALVRNGRSIARVRIVCGAHE
jgi:hypothetical protein